jgi:hypothetical protein
MGRVGKLIPKIGIEKTQKTGFFQAISHYGTAANPCRLKKRHEQSDLSRGGPGIAVAFYALLEIT